MVADTEHEDKRPASRRVADDLLSRIDGGQYQPGSSLPPYRQLAQEYGVAVNTAHAAVRLLRDSGIVTIRPNASAKVRDPETDPDVGSELSAARTEVAGLRAQADHLSAELQKLEARLTTVAEQFGDRD